MKQVVIYHKMPSETVKELRESGMVTGVDFDFAFVPMKYIQETNTWEPRYTTFTFYNDGDATMFALKYS